MKKEVIKASGAIHIPHKINLIQQQLWNALLAEAFPKLKENQKFRISENQLLEYFPYETRHTDRIKEGLRVLVGTIVEYNILGKDNTMEWGVFTLLAQAKLKNGFCTFAYAPDLQEKLNSPAIYAKISLLIQQRFGSKYSLALYELCIDYEKYGTPMMELAEFREYMGVEPHEYPRIYDLKRWVIEDPIKEINEKSDILISYKTKKTSRKISHIKFLVERKENKPFENLKIEPPAVPDIENKLLDEILALRISKNIAEDSFKQYSEEEIKQAIEYRKNYDKPVKSENGFFINTLKNKWYDTVDPLPKILEWFDRLDQHQRIEIVYGLREKHPGKDLKKSEEGQKFLQEKYYSKIKQGELL